MLELWLSHRHSHSLSFNVADWKDKILLLEDFIHFIMIAIKMTTIHSTICVPGIVLDAFHAKKLKIHPWRYKKK